MHVRVLGCHGGTSRDHQSVSFLVNGRLALDAGSLASGLDLSQQKRLETVLVTHSHLDHVCDLGSVVEIRVQQGGDPLTIAGLPETIAALRAHFFNDVLWPDFTRIQTGRGPMLLYQELIPERVVRFGDIEVMPVLVEHSVPSCGFMLGTGQATLAYTGDTGPTERIWEVINECTGLRALITEVSFPDRMSDLARRTGHLTPSSFAEQMAKVVRRPRQGLYVYGLKPVFAEEIERELAKLDLKGVQLLRASLEFDA
jgi:ribonuclease BN (tRNA processing enzyme)